MFLMAFGVQEMAVGGIQVAIAKQCQDNFSRLLNFTAWDSFVNIATIRTP